MLGLLEELLGVAVADNTGLEVGGTLEEVEVLGNTTDDDEAEGALDGEASIAEELDRELEDDDGPDAGGIGFPVMVGVSLVYA